MNNATLSHHRLSQIRGALQGGEWVDSWTRSLRCRCHRHRTGPRSCGLPWTPVDCRGSRRATRGRPAGVLLCGQTTLGRIMMLVRTIATIVALGIALPAAAQGIPKAQSPEEV